MRRRSRIVVAGMLLAATMTGDGAAVAEGEHVLTIGGTSTIQNQCQYIWMRDVTTGEAIRDELGIPQPAHLPPRCRLDAQLRPIPCSLKRNTYPATYPPYWRDADTTEVGPNAPCAGTLTFATFDGPQGCVDVSAQGPNCAMNAPTWFYGYCAQTYGGATGGTLQLGGQVWTIERLGFARGRGIWEFGGRMKRGTEKVEFRLYFDALPDKVAEGETLACDGGPPISSVVAAGLAIIPAPPVKVIRTKPGWHFCTNDSVGGFTNDIC